MKELRNVEADLRQFRLRALVATAAVIVAFTLIWARAYYLQVVQYENLNEQAERNRTAVVPVVPMRGEVEDRNGEILASNYSAYTLEITPSKVPDLDAVLSELEPLVTISKRDRRRFNKLLSETKAFEAIPIRTLLSDEEVARFAAQRWRFPGVEIRARFFRNYPLGATASHLVGYIGRINQREQDEIESWPDEERANYRGTDYIGKLGIEQFYEKELHGETGIERIETSAGGRAVRILDSRPARPGRTIELTIDAKLQQLTEQLFGDRRGALVAIDPRNGEILAFVSAPTFDPNLFVEGIDVESWRALADSPDKPLLNRAIRGRYPPGSTYKPFMGLAALELGKRSPQATTYDPGYWIFGDNKFRSHGDEGLGNVDLRTSIVKSSNTYYYALANDLGVDAIHDFMAPFGFGQITGIDLHGEQSGILPSQAWKRAAYKRADQQRWYAGETISLGIGQGYNSFTMLQLASATATLANRGVQYPPHLMRAIRDSRNSTAQTMSSVTPRDLNLNQKNVDHIIEAMVGVTQEGTSRLSFANAPYLSAGKTGTAQAVTIGQNEKYDAKKLAEYERDHALYIAFAPTDAPEIALAIVVENAGFGSAHAAPIARRVFDYVLLGQYPSEADIAAVQQGQATAPIGEPRAVADVPLIRTVDPTTSE
ncbi:penicillin-binding protein 2 [Betaproteobacteria bacterium LSUCC0117]|jgi:penicillin-binding protein 2|nr:penicillin-binding protein 2 [Betaproteobacteria bacterium LSUCC0117]MDP4670958.1 penicillin-binding protein 2 [Burkholderiaceae bacterium]MDP4862501.1 penicillin-binding protein 2 [Burkholderiaceae bacterium]